MKVQYFVLSCHNFRLPQMTFLCLFLKFHFRTVFQSILFVVWVILRRNFCIYIAYGESGRLLFHSWNSKGISLVDLIDHYKFRKSYGTKDFWNREIGRNVPSCAWNNRLKSLLLGFQTLAQGNEDYNHLSKDFQTEIIDLNQEILRSKGSARILNCFLFYVYRLKETLVFLS
jgi:hypothetical protein